MAEAKANLKIRLIADDLDELVRLRCMNTNCRFHWECGCGLKVMMLNEDGKCIDQEPMTTTGEEQNGTGL